MNGASVNMIRRSRSGGIVKNKLSLTTPPSQARISVANPLREFVEPKPQGYLIDEALAIINSPGSTTSSKSLMRRKGSKLSARRANELLLDNSDCLSSLVQSGDDVDLDSDCESDLDV